MRRHITLLLFIGLAWGQEYDPETGEVVKKQYDPETGELIKDQNYPDSLVSPSHPKVNSDLKNISIYNLTKEQKKKYNQNRIRIRKKNFDWYAYIQKGVFSSKRLNKTDFFIYTGYPDKAEIAEHNTQLYVKNYWLGGGLTYLLGIGAVSVGLEGAGFAIMFGGWGYFFYDYNVKKLARILCP